MPTKITILDLGATRCATFELNQNMTLASAKAEITKQSGTQTIESLVSEIVEIEIKTEAAWQTWRTSTLASNQTSIELLMIQPQANIQQKQDISLTILEQKRDLLSASEDTQDQYISTVIQCLC